MHPTPSLVSGSIEDAIAALAERSVQMRHGAPRLSKEAMDKSAFLADAGKNIGGWWKGLDPAAQKTLAGAGIGGALGLGSSLFKDKEDRNMVGSGVTGALAGGAIGAGLGLAGKYGPKPGPGTGFGEGEFMHDGQKYRWGDNLPPEVAAEIAERHSGANKGTLAGNIAKGVGDTVTAIGTSPEGQAAIGTGGLLAAGKTGATAKPDSWLGKLFSPWMQNTDFSQVDDAKTMRKGMDRALGLGDIMEEFGYKGKKDEIKNAYKAKILTDGLGKGTQGGTVVEKQINPKTLSTSFNNVGEVRNWLQNADDATLQALARGDDTIRIAGKKVDPGFIRKIKELGVGSQVGGTWWGKAGEKAVPEVRKSLLGSLGLGPKYIPKNKLSGVRRFGKYAIPIGSAAYLTHLLQGRANQSVNQGAFDELVRQYAKPVQ